MTLKLLCLVSVLALFYEVTESRNAFRQMFPVKYPEMIQNGVDPGEPLFLTPYIESGNIKKGSYLVLFEKNIWSCKRIMIQKNNFTKMYVCTHTQTHIYIQSIYHSIQE